MILCIGINKVETITKVSSIEQAVKLFKSLADVNKAFKDGLISSDLFLNLLEYFNQR